MTSQAPAHQIALPEVNAMDFFIAVKVDNYIGLVITPGTGLVDPGAQSGCMGIDSLKPDEKELAKFGLRVIWLDRNKCSAHGVGGSATSLGTVLVPAGIAGTNGLLMYAIVDNDVPPLVPILAFDRLGGVINYPNSTVKAR